MRLWRHARRFLVPALLLASAPLAAQEIGPPSVQYSADRLLRGGPGETIIGRVFYGGDRERWEFTGPKGVRVIILRRDTGDAWVLAPGERLAMKSDLGRLPSPSLLPRGRMKTRAIGTGTVNGVAATKYELNGERARGGRFDGFVWISPQNIMLRYEGVVRHKSQQQRVLMELSNLKIGPQDRSLFEVPSGFKVVRPNQGGKPAQ